MRTLTSSQLASNGTEPLIILRVDWGSGIGTRYYGERAFVLGSKTVVAGILEISDLTSQVRQNDIGAVASINFKLDDSIGLFKSIYDTVDVERKPAYIYQHFDGDAEGDLATLFQGVVTGPVSWDEDQRTFSFAVETNFLQKQVGFAPDFATGSAGNSILTTGDGIDDGCIGKAWPIVFGTVYKAPAVRIYKAPTTSVIAQNGNALLLEDTNRFPAGGCDMLIDGVLFRGNLTGNTYTITDANIPYYGTSIGFASRDPADPDVDNPQVAWLANYRPIIGLVCHIEFSDFLTIDPTDTAAGLTFSVRDRLTPRCVKQYGNKIWFDSALTNNAGAELLLGAGEQITMASKEPQPGWPSAFDSKGSSGFQVVRVGGVVSSYRWNFGAGTQVKYVGIVDKYVCNIFGTTVHAVYANKRGRLELVPSRYYNVTTETIFGQLAATITFSIPLEQFFDQGWDGSSIYVTQTSARGSSLLLAIKYLIDNYTLLTCDDSNFGALDVIGECNFSLAAVKNALQLAEQIAYQAGLGIIVDGDIVKLTQFAYKGASVMTISEDDVEQGSFVLGLTDLNDVYTKVVAQWRQEYVKDLRLVLMRNQTRYGVIETSVDYFAFTAYQELYVSTFFWLNRKANTWKTVSFKLDMPGVALEVFDIVTIDFALIGAVDGMVIKTAYSTKDQQVDVTVLLPFAAGTSSVDANFWIDSLSIPSNTFPPIVHFTGVDAVDLLELKDSIPDVLDQQKSSNSPTPAIITQTLGDSRGDYLVDIYADGFTDTSGNAYNYTRRSVPARRTEENSTINPGDKTTVVLSGSTAFIQASPAATTEKIAKITAESPAGTYAISEFSPPATTGASLGTAKELNGSVGIAVDTIVIVKDVGGSYWFWFPISTCT